jgi:uncharacterized protein involved in outer membrane biogenesis
MRKILAVVAGLVFAASLGAGLWFYWRLDSIVRRAIVERLEEATGVDVRLESVRLDARNQSGELLEFRLGNPPGYPAGEALFRFDHAEVGLDVASLRQPVVRIRKVELRGATVYYSGKTSGNNLQALAARVAERSAPDSSAPAQEGRLVSIGSFVINDARIRIDLPGVGATPELALGTISFRDLGGADGSTAGEIMRTISSRVSDRATAEVAKALPRMAVELGLSPEKLAEMVGLPVPGPVREAADFLRGIFGR